jgi:CheY-like chemotaxis protein
MHLLVVDDDPTFLFIFRKQIEKHDGIRILHEAENGQVALDFIRESLEKNLPIPTLIILDINMPVMDGWQFLDHYESLEVKPRIPVCILSSTINQADFDKANEYDSVKAFFSKPLTSEQVSEMKGLVQSGN